MKKRRMVVAIAILMAAIFSCHAFAEEPQTETPTIMSVSESSETPGETPEQPGSETPGETPEQPGSETPGETPEQPGSETPGDRVHRTDGKKK